MLTREAAAEWEPGVWGVRGTGRPTLVAMAVVGVPKSGSSVATARYSAVSVLGSRAWHLPRLASRQNLRHCFCPQRALAWLSVSAQDPVTIVLSHNSTNVHQWMDG